MKPIHFFLIILGIDYILNLTFKKWEIWSVVNKLL